MERTRAHARAHTHIERLTAKQNEESAAGYSERSNHDRTTWINSDVVPKRRSGTGALTGRPEGEVGREDRHGECTEARAGAGEEVMGLLHFGCQWCNETVITTQRSRQQSQIRMIPVGQTDPELRARTVAFGQGSHDRGGLWTLVFQATTSYVVHQRWRKSPSFVAEMSRDANWSLNTQDEDIKTDEDGAVWLACVVAPAHPGLYI